MGPVGICPVCGEAYPKATERNAVTARAKRLTRMWLPSIAKEVIGYAKTRNNP